MKWQISVIDNREGLQQPYCKEGDEVRIGRDAAGNDLVVSNLEVSRQHLILYVKNGYFYLQDLGSKNGSFIRINDGWAACNGTQRIDLPCRLRLGKHLVIAVEQSLGDGTLSFSDNESLSVTPRPEDGILEATSAAFTVTHSLSSALPQDLRLEQYQIQRVLGRGAFGITYLALDRKLDRKVAIKEFFPLELAKRGGSHRVELPKQNEVEFTQGLKRFLEEGQLLAKHSHPNLVRVHTYFEALGTAYLVMEFEQGESLASILERGGLFSETELLGVVFPLLDGLRQIHRTGLIHRDIKPANIFIRRDRTPVLLDFGSARNAMKRKTMTSMFTKGYAPFEQYDTDGRQQGPWTDVYALAAVCYHMITGQIPEDSQIRLACSYGARPDPLPPLKVAAPPGRYSQQLLKAVTLGMALQVSDRPTDMAAWASMLPRPTSGSLATPQRSGGGEEAGAAVDGAREQAAAGAARSETDSILKGGGLIQKLKRSIGGS